MGQKTSSILVNRTVLSPSFVLSKSSKCNNKRVNEEEIKIKR